MATEWTGCQFETRSGAQELEQPFGVPGWTFAAVEDKSSFAEVTAIQLQATQLSVIGIHLALLHALT